MSLQPDQQEKYISIWSKAVDTQMHFNEMSVKSRQLGLTFVAAALGVAIVLLSRGIDFAFLVDIPSIKFRIHISVLLVLGALLALAAVRVLDLNVYHRMLRGAVAFGEDFEEHYMKQIFELDKGMTQAISHFSRYDDAAIEPSKSGKFTYTGSTSMTAAEKIRKFYNNAIYYLLGTAAALFLITNVDIWFDKSSDPSVENGAVTKIDIQSSNAETGATTPDVETGAIAPNAETGAATPNAEASTKNGDDRENTDE